MKERSLTIPKIAVIGGTHVALGVGSGLLLCEKLNKEQRRSADGRCLASASSPRFRLR
jgi:hypothetical protein